MVRTEHRGSAVHVNDLGNKLAGLIFYSVCKVEGCCLNPVTGPSSPPTNCQLGMYIKN